MIYTTLRDYADIATRPTVKLLALPVDGRLDALQRDVLVALTNACARRGGALYGSLGELQAACGVSDLERLYECGMIELLRDQDGWYFVQMEDR